MFVQRIDHTSTATARHNRESPDSAVSKPAILAGLTHDPRGGGKIPLRIDLGHECLPVPKHGLASFKAEKLAKLGRAGMPQLIWRPMLGLCALACFSDR